MDSIAVSELRANLMSVIKEIEHGASIKITSRGVVVAKLVPPDYSKERALKRLDEISKTATIGDIVSPIETAWEAMQ